MFPLGGSMNFGILGLSVLLMSFAAHASSDLYKDLFDAVQLDPMVKNLRMMTGYDPVTIDGQTFAIPTRDNDKNKKLFRKFFVNYFQALGIPVQEQPYGTDTAGTIGTNVEAVLQGRSKDSIIVVSHYDSTGVANNPAVDDAASGIAIMMETAKLLAPYQSKLSRTIRFVVADHEEDTGSGDREYGSYITRIARWEGFKIAGTIDFDQSGWLSPTNDGNQIDVYVDGAEQKSEMTDVLDDTIKSYSDLRPKYFYGNIGDDANVMTGVDGGVCPSEKDNQQNPFKDARGDTLETLTMSYYLRIAKLDVAFVAKAAQINP